MAKPKIVRRSPVGLAQEGLPEGLTLRREGISVGIRPLPQMASVAPRVMSFTAYLRRETTSSASAPALRSLDLRQGNLWRPIRLPIWR